MTIDTLPTPDATHAAGPLDATAPDPREPLAERLLGDLVGAMELFAIHVGRATGPYDHLRGEPITGADLVSSSGLHPDYVTAWLDQQAAAGLVEVDDPGVPASGRRHHLTAATAEVLLDDTSPFHLGPAGPFAVSVGRATPAVVEAFRTGGGVAYADYGRELRTAIAAFNRPMVEGDLVSTWGVVWGGPRSNWRGPTRTPRSAGWTSTWSRCTTPARSPRNGAWPTGCRSPTPMPGRGTPRNGSTS